MTWKTTTETTWTGDSRPIREAIRIQMVRRDLKHSDLVNLLGFKSNSTLSRRMNGQTDWRYEDLETLADNWGMHIEDFTGEPPTPVTEE